MNAKEKTMNTTDNKNNKILFFKINFVLFYFFLNLISYLIIVSLTRDSILKILIALLVVFLFLMPFYVYKNRNQLLILAGYLWMGMVILFLTLVFILILISYFFNVLEFTEVVYLSLIVSFLLTIYSYKRVDDIKTKFYNINVEGMGESKKLKILHLSDLHWGLIVGEERLKKIIDKVNNISADILLFTGDIVDGQAIDLEFLSNLLKKIKVNIVKIAVKGNHECFFNDKIIYEMFRSAGFVLLVNQIFKVNDKIAIIGLSEDYKIEELNIDDRMFNIVLRHIPIIDEKIRFSLQLSGHTHGGQFFPITMLTKLMFRYNSGLYKLKNNSILYVSSGVGTWLPPLRLTTLPEITVFNLIGA